MNAQAPVPMDIGLSAVINENLFLSHGVPPAVAASMGTVSKEIFYYSRQ
jgi:hypothetical protein